MLCNSYVICNSSGHFFKCIDTPSQLFPRNHLSHQSASLAAAHRVAPVARLMPTRLAPVLNFQKVREGSPPPTVYQPLPPHTTDCIALVQTAPKYGNHFCFKARAQLRAPDTGHRAQHSGLQTADYGLRSANVCPGPGTTVQGLHRHGCPISEWPTFSITTKECRSLFIMPTAWPPDSTTSHFLAVAPRTQIVELCTGRNLFYFNYFEYYYAIPGTNNPPFDTLLSLNFKV